ncbi:MAG: hypothetical protein F8N37_08825 [Telmatospirillum sp.]|nr:hypothetical protein [Telmatospirillum sp.]
MSGPWRGAPITGLKASDVLEDVEKLGMTDGAARALAPLRALAVRGAMVSDASPGTRSLREMLGRYSFCLRDDMRRHLSDIPVFHCPVPEFLAYSSERDGSPYVVVFSGVADAALYRLSLAVLIDHLLGWLRRTSTEPEVASRHLGALGILARDLSLDRMGRLDSLPKFLDRLAARHQSQIVDGLLGCLTYVAMHEIGHVVLGHVGASAVPASLSRAREYAADRFAFDAIRPPHRVSFVTNMLIAFELYADKERLLGDSPDHPPVIDRIDTIAEIVGAYGDEFHGDRVRAILDGRRTARWTPVADDDRAMEALTTLTGLYDRAMAEPTCPDDGGAGQVGSCGCHPTVP